MGVCLTTLNYIAVKDLIKNNLLINNKNTMSILPNHKDINLEKIKDALSPSATHRDLSSNATINKVFKQAAIEGQFEHVKELIKEYSDELEPFDIQTKRLIAFRGNVKILKYIDGAYGARAPSGA